MTTTLTIRLPEKLARDLKVKARAARTSPSAILREAASNYVRKNPKNGATAMQRHIDARAGTWDGDVSGVELLKLTRP